MEETGDKKRIVRIGITGIGKRRPMCFETVPTVCLVAVAFHPNASFGG